MGWQQSFILVPLNSSFLSFKSFITTLPNQYLNFFILSYFLHFYENYLLVIVTLGECEKALVCAHSLYLNDNCIIFINYNFVLYFLLSLQIKVIIIIIFRADKINIIFWMYFRVTKARGFEPEPLKMGCKQRRLCNSIYE